MALPTDRVVWEAVGRSRSKLVYRDCVSPLAFKGSELQYIGRDVSEMLELERRDGAGRAVDQRNEQIWLGALDRFHTSSGRRSRSS